MLYFQRLLFATWSWLPIAERKIKENNCVNVFDCTLQLTFSQSILGQKSQYGHIYMQSWNQKWTLVYKFSGTYLCHVVEWRHMLLRKCLSGDGSSKWNQYYLVFLAHRQWGCILSGICRSFFHSLKFFLQLLINLPWKHWCFNALLT